MKRGGLRPPTKDRLAVHRRVKLHVYISFYIIYAYQISDFHLNNKKRGASGPMPGPFPDPKGVSPYICKSLYSILYEQVRSQGGTTGPNFQGPGFRGARIFLTIASARRALNFDRKNPLYRKIAFLKGPMFSLRALRGILRLFSCPKIHQELLFVP